MSWVTDPWATTFGARAGIALIIVGALGGVVGVFVLIRGRAFAAEAFAHTAFPGAVAAAAVGASLTVGSAFAVVVAAGLIVLLARGTPTHDDSAIAIVFTSMLATGALLFSLLGPFDRDISSFVFGSLLGTTTADLVLLATGATIMCAALWGIHRPLIAGAFDAEAAHAVGGRQSHVELVFLGLLAVTVVIVVRAMGNLLVLAMLVTPAATARLVADRLPTMLRISVGVGVASSILGFYFSYHAATATGASVVLAATAIFVITFILRTTIRLGMRRSAPSAG